MNPHIVEREVQTRFSRAALGRGKERFLKGPIPMRQITLAANLPGQALAVFLAIVHRRDLTQKDWVTLPAQLLGELGVSRDAKCRALIQLENAALIQTEKTLGKSTRVRLSGPS